jgi:hypothetical protein
MQLKTSILFTLFLVIILSKEVLVFNEELLILFAFLIFLFFVRNFASNFISIELDNRSNKIREDFNYFRDVQIKTYSHLIVYHTKQKLLSSEVNAISYNLKQSISLVLSIYNKKYLKSVSNVIDDKLKKVATHQLKFDSNLQHIIRIELCNFLKLQYNKKKNIRKLFLKKSIVFLSNIK